MGRERDNEKKFNEYLDRILAGEEIKADPSMDKELCDALDFACKMADLRQNPRAQFESRLKADLLQKLEARQAQKQAARGSFWDVFRNHPAWQGAVAVLLVVIVIAVAWRAGVFQPLSNEKATQTTTKPGVVTMVPAPTITIPAPAPAPTYTLAPPAQEVIAPSYLWVIIIIGIVLAIAIIILTGRTRRLVWQGAVAVLLVIIVVAVVWRAGVFQFTPLELSQATTPPATTSAASKTTAAATTAAPATKVPMTTSPEYYDRGLGGTLVSIDAKSDKTSYQSGETVQIELSMKNVSGNQLTVEDFPPILSVMREDTGQPVYTFTAGKAAYTLAPEGVATYTYSWKQQDYEGNALTGKYYIELEDLEYNGVPIYLILNKPVNFEIILK